LDIHRDMTSITQDDVVALRKQMTTLEEIVDRLTQRLDTLPTRIADETKVNLVAAMSDIKDEISGKLTELSKTSRSPKKRDDTTASDEKEKSGEFVPHPNFPKLTSSAWAIGKTTNVKIYTLQMFKNYPEHMKTVLPDDFYAEFMNSEETKKALSDLPEKTSDHNKAKVQMVKFWKYSKDVKREDEIIKLIDADRTKENGVRTSGAVDHVPTENMTPEEVVAASDDEEKKE
jgi:hypothetical protein